MSVNSTKTPSIRPPAGRTAFESDENTLWKWNVLTLVVCIIFTTIPFALRTYVRAFIRREWKFEDYMACLAWIGLVGSCGLMAKVFGIKGGVHQWNMIQDEVPPILYWFSAYGIMYSIEVLICKLVILMIYRRVFVPVRWSFFDIVLRFFEISMIIFYVAQTIAKVFECTPRQRIWDKRIPGKCINKSMQMDSSGLFNLITDVLILLIPVKSVWKLKLNRAKKIRIVLVFTFGWIAPIFSLIGYIYRKRVTANPDKSYNYPLILLWAQAEVATGAICVCLPPISALFHAASKKGPTQSILNGRYHRDPGRGSYATSKSKPAVRINEDDSLEGLFEMKDKGGLVVTTELPKPSYTANAFRGSDDTEFTFEVDNKGDRKSEILGGGKNDIVKTVRVERSYS